MSRARGWGLLLCWTLPGVWAGCGPQAPEIQRERAASAAQLLPSASAPPTEAALSASAGPASRPLDPRVLASASASASASEPEAPPEKALRSGSGRLVASVRGGKEIWIAEGGAERRLVGGATLVVENPGANLPPLENEGLFALSFSPDERRVYFMKSGWATSSALFYAEVATGKVFFFHDANGYQVIQSCKSRAQVGRVITFEHSYFDINPMSASDLYFLVDAAAPAGKQPRTGNSGRVGPIGFADENVARFLARTCGVGEAPAAAPTVLPARLRGNPVRCKNFLLWRADLRLLDGTTVLRFRPEPSPEGPVLFDAESAAELCE